MARNPITVTRNLAKTLAGGAPQSEAEKALAAADAADKRANDFRDQNQGWRFAGKPHSQEALAKLEADLKRLKVEAKVKRQTYLDITGQTRADRRDPNAPKGPDKGKTGLRRRTEDRTPPITIPDKPKFNKGAVTNDALGQHADETSQYGLKAQKQRTADGRLNAHDIFRLPKGNPDHPDNITAQADFGTMGDQAKQARDAAIKQRGIDQAKSAAEQGKAKAKGEQAQGQKDLKLNSGNADHEQALKVADAMLGKMKLPTPKPKPPEDTTPQGGLKLDSKPGAGDRRTNNPSGLHKLAVSQGWTEKRTKNGWMLQSPDGKHQVAYHLSHSDHRATANMRAELERGGLQIPGRRSGDIKTDVSTGDTAPRGPIPPLPKTGPGTFDINTGDRTPRIPSPKGTPGYGPGPGGLVLPKPKLPPTGPGTNDQNTGGPPIIPRGNGTIITKTAGDNGTTSGENRFNHAFPQQDPNKPKVVVEGPGKNVPHKGKTFQKAVEPYVKPTFQPKPPPTDQPLRHAVIQARIQAETNRLVQRGSTPAPQPANKPRVERDFSVEPVRRIDWSKHLRRK